MKVVRETKNYCTLCEENETVKEIKGNYICETCIQEVKSIIEDNKDLYRHGSNDSQ